MTRHDQCDQMARLFFHYMAINNNENFAQCQKCLPKKVEFFCQRLSLKQRSKYFFLILPKWRIFAKSGHTVHDTVLL